MKKIILLVVLSFAFVLSIFAQTNYKSNTSSAVSDEKSVKDIAEKGVDLSALAVNENAPKNAANSTQRQLLIGDAINLADATILRISKTSGKTFV